MSSGESPELLRCGLLVGGREVPAASGGTLTVVSPATGRPVAVVACAEREDVDAAVHAAREAFDAGTWRDLPPAKRARVLHRFADGIERRLEDLYVLESVNNGRSIRETRAQVSRVPEWFRYSAALLLADRSDLIPIAGPYHSYTTRFPLGVVAILSSFNHPLMIGSKSLAPALATGNSVVLKLTFTGGTDAGRSVAVAAAAHLAKATVELGGKSPVLVFADADLKDAVRGAAFAGFVAAGQTCIAGTRLLVQREVHDEFVAGLVAQALTLHVGDPSSPDTDIGPVISDRARERIVEYVRIGCAEGARVAVGGGATTVGGLEGGFFVEPTVLVGVTNQMRVAREEIFGPVLVVIPFDDEDDAVMIANDSPYGLGSAVWTGNVARALRVANRLTHGIVWVNDHHRLDPASPWGGVRGSGVGREGGWESFHDFTQIRSVTVRIAEEGVNWYGGEHERLD